MTDHTDLIARLGQYEGQPWETTACYNGLRDEARAALSAAAEREREMREALDQMTRNRDMWKGQCERQADELGRFRSHFAAYHKTASEFHNVAMDVLSDSDFDLYQALADAEAEYSVIAQPMATAALREDSDASAPASEGE